MDDRTVDLIFAGSLESLPPVSSKIVRIFTSSTFTDTTLERNTLMAQVYPKIKDFCREKHGLEFQPAMHVIVAYHRELGINVDMLNKHSNRDYGCVLIALLKVVDMRWGVRDEATDDHMTTELCMKEIENCQRLSMGPNFVVFLGQKYGYRPIPTYILSSELQLLRDELVAGGTDASLLDLWYRKDANAVPPVSVLQPISSILVNFNNKRVPKLQQQDQAVWWDTLGKMQKLLRKAALSLFNAEQLSKDSMHSYFMSVTEREVINGILNVKNTRNHCLAYVRYINNINLQNLRKASLFIDILNRSIDTEATKLLGNLRDERLPAKIESSNLQRYTVEWIGREGLDTETHEEYLSHFLTHFYRSITKLVDRAMRKEDSSAQGQIVTEILQHLHACNNSVKVFYGREDDLERIHLYMVGDQAEEDGAGSNEERRPLVLYGEGGCGKTSLLAKSASMTPEWFAGTRPVCIIRFLGTTPDSSALTPTLISICQQISYNYMLPFEEIPDDLVPLMAHFKHLLTFASAQQPLLLSLDSVDQLTGAQGANKVSWLPTRLPPHCKLVVSCAEEADNPEVSRDYHLLRRMIDVEENFIKVTDLGEDLAMQVIRMWMRSGHRDLTNYQWRLVANAIGQCSLPIFVKLVFAEVCRWRSYTKPQETHLASTVMDSIMMLFERIEKQHGRILVFHALAYITAAKSGLSESELEDLISLDDRVLDDVYQYHMPPVRRIPPLLWTRIRNDLPNYLSEREADGVNVLNWYHRQFRDTAKERYFKNMNMATYFHSSIADYYSGIWGGGNPKPFRYTEIQRHRFNLTEKEGSADRKVPIQPLVFVSKDGKVSRYNLRKFGEMPYHLVRSRRFEDLFSQVLFNYQWLHAKLSSCPLQAVLSDFEDACSNIEDREATRELVLVADALRLGGAVLGIYPDMLAPQLVGRLLPEIGLNPNVRSLLRQCDAEGTDHCALIPYFHCLHTPGGPLKYSLEGHQFAVFGFRLTSDYRYIVSISNKFITWDLSTSDLARDVNPGLQGIMQQLVLSPDNRFASAYTNNNQTVLLNMLTNEFIILDNPLDEGEHVTGLYLLNTHLFIHGKRSWCQFDMRGRLQEKKNCNPPGGPAGSDANSHWTDAQRILTTNILDFDPMQNGEMDGSMGYDAIMDRSNSTDNKSHNSTSKKLNKRNSQALMQLQHNGENEQNLSRTDSTSDNTTAAVIVNKMKKQRSKKDPNATMMSELDNEHSDQSLSAQQKNMIPNILLYMEFTSLDTYQFLYWTGELDSPQMVLQTTKASVELEPFYFHSAMVMTKDKTTMYCCSTPNRYLVSKHQLGENGWEFVSYLPLPLKKKRLKRDDESEEDEEGFDESNASLNGWDEDDEVENSQSKDIAGVEDEQMLLQLKLDKEEATLLATASYGFVVWQDIDGGLSRTREDNFCNLDIDPNAEVVHVPMQVTALPLPYGVRNISTRLLQSNSVVVSANRDVAIAGVRKNLYVWKLEDGELMKILDAHFGRIISLEPLTVGNWNSVITSSIDRTVKVWNVNNIFEQVHVIDRHELQIDSISLCQEAGIAVTVTRGCVGVWDIRTGRLMSRLADSPLGAIVTHAQITADGKYIVSSESGNVLVWNRLLEQVLFREEQPGIVQLTLIEGGSKFLAVSRPPNPASAVSSEADTETSSSQNQIQDPHQPPPEEQTSSRCVMVVRSLPSGVQLFSYEFTLRSTLPYRGAVTTSDGQWMVIISNSGSGTENEKQSKKGGRNKPSQGEALSKRRDSSSSVSTTTSTSSKRSSSAKSDSGATAATASPVTTLLVLNSQTGSLMHRVTLRLGAGKDPICLVPMPNKPQQVAVVTSGGGDSGAGGAAGGGAALVDVRTRRVVRWIPRWGGHMTKDGKFGLCAPPRGGLELLELKKGGGTVGTFIPRVAEGVFTVATAFNRTDEYVLYYHSGHKTLRVFRTGDGTMIANYRVQAEVSALESTEDGMAVVIGTVDGCMSILAIADPTKPQVAQFLATLPSRDEEWKKKMGKRRASTRFKAAASVAQLVTHFNTISQHSNSANFFASSEE